MTGPVMGTRFMGGLRIAEPVQKTANLRPRSVVSFQCG